jgi:methylenetetrahydrofolate/methylenetetrahydromethanopterin dehydrogenase (NADP+)
MTTTRILIQLDTDPHASSFDAVVAIDAGAQQLLQYHSVEPTSVQSIVHGAMFTRGGKELAHTAIFIGGSDVALSEAIAAEVHRTFFGPVRVSVMLDPNGSNTTAAAAVLCASKHIDLHGATTLVLAGTGPVGRRVARLLARQGSTVRLASRDLQRAEQACQSIEAAVPGARLDAFAVDSNASIAEALHDCQAVFACGAAGVTLIDHETFASAKSLAVAIDLNAVPPLGIAGIQATHKGHESDGRTLYGALGVGGLKMKIHKATIAKLFSANDLVFDAEQIYDIGRGLVVSG